ncbi:diphosphomevalonate decarboxylase [Coxiella endosymbiont of Amblyomma sculptum]|uniref:diphosphomevalonate decarboxylase n=1 Tax=Coxiella endosymbiont of Amblyomma sculptum TaxID=2487929 RepID=UPI00132EB0A1|nr:diphosphomevalonate decarboxylase [Coxiella endosymbiont of Amblyomma sculptum]QHG92337.1 diphosphomevalonate decarboxylase [Coxiella endosymbiont of Amblyomma sculptum]
MKHNEIFYQLLDRKRKTPIKSFGQAFAPSNIALCKYWGKRNLQLNLPFTSSLSLSLGNRGACAKISFSSHLHHELIVNHKKSSHSKHYLIFLEELIFFSTQSFRLELDFNVPIATGLASSACSYAAIVKATNDFFGWNLNEKILSILARMGSGSACRSIFEGFVQWHRGTDPNGMDSYAEQINESWPELRIGICIISSQKKTISSREGMNHTTKTSEFYTAWIQKANKDFLYLKKAIVQRDFSFLGKITESNALAMHATMLTAWPPLMYFVPDTIRLIQKVWKLRDTGLEVYFTQDAGANVKLLFLKKDNEKLIHHFPDLEIVSPFKEAVVQKVVLVDEKDQILGIEEKIKVHCEGKLHRAFSIFVFSWKNSEWQLLLQERHLNKYHSGGLWTNTCCGHPRPGENIIKAGERRLFEEMGLKISLQKAKTFRYTAKVGDLIENEYDYVLIGFSILPLEGISFNRKEVSAIRWVNLSVLKREINNNAENFAPWFVRALEIALQKLHQKFSDSQNKTKLSL